MLILTLWEAVYTQVVVHALQCDAMRCLYLSVSLSYINLFGSLQHLCPSVRRSQQVTVRSYALAAHAGCPGASLFHIESLRLNSHETQFFLTWLFWHFLNSVSVCYSLFLS